MGTLRFILAPTDLKYLINGGAILRAWDVNGTAINVSVEIGEDVKSDD